MNDALDIEPDAEKDRRRGGGTRIQSVARAARLLIWVAEQRHGATVREIADSQGLALPTTYHLINTLVDEGLLTKDAQRRFVLGSSAVILAHAYLRGKAVPEALLAGLRELARRTGETVYLADWGENEIRVLASVEGVRMLRVAESGSGAYQHGHARANGKVLLAYASPEVREAYLRNHPLVPVTDRTITARRRMDQELETVRDRGYAYDEEEFSEGVCCVAAPLLHNSRVIGAIGISVPAERFRATQAELTATLLETVETLRHVQGEPAAAAEPA